MALRQSSVEDGRWRAQSRACAATPRTRAQRNGRGGDGVVDLPCRLDGIGRVLEHALHRLERQLGLQALQRRRALADGAHKGGVLHLGRDAARHRLQVKDLRQQALALRRLELAHAQQPQRLLALAGGARRARARRAHLAAASEQGRCGVRGEGGAAAKKEKNAWRRRAQGETRRASSGRGAELGRCQLPR